MALQVMKVPVSLRLSVTTWAISGRLVTEQVGIPVLKRPATNRFIPGVKWIASTCGSCEFCLNGTDECHCPNQKNSGYSVPGTFQQYVLADGRYTSHLPDGVKDEEAGPIMCGGVTAYTACKRSGVRPGQWIVIPGAGGGLGHFAVQYAKAMVSIDRSFPTSQLPFSSSGGMKANPFLLVNRV